MNDIRERVAHAMWKAEAVRAAPKTVPDRRTLEAFLDSSEEERARWLSLADAAIAEIGGVRVKKLKWHRPARREADWADSTGVYEIEDSVLFIGHFADGIAFESGQGARDAAQADYEQRILSAIQPAPIGVGEAAKVLLDAAEHDHNDIKSTEEVMGSSYAEWGDMDSRYQQRMVGDVIRRALTTEGEG